MNVIAENYIAPCVISALIHGFLYFCCTFNNMPGRHFYTVRHHLRSCVKKKQLDSSLVPSSLSMPPSFSLPLSFNVKKFSLYIINCMFCSSYWLIITKGCDIVSRSSWAAALSIFWMEISLCCVACWAE